PDGPSNPSSPWLLRALVPFMNYCASRKQRRRLDELKRKITTAVQENLGDKAHEYFVLDLLVTHPAYQGHGYGSALLKALAWMADAADRQTWLISSNTINNKFYESFGYRNIADIVLGDEDPDYDDEPFVVSLVSLTP
ncbi:hypothetical protein FA95DRAFT_1491543, partial [Auriscalpium vulgare]